MNREEFNRKYLEAVHKAALGIKIIRIKGEEMGFDVDTLDSNEVRLVEVLAEGIGLPVQSVWDDVLDQVDHFPPSFFRRSDVRQAMGQMLGSMQANGFLTHQG